MPPSQPPIVVIKLKPGWVFEPSLPGFRLGGRCVLVALPPGARLDAALPIEPAAHRTPAEDEIARFVLLHWPGADDATALALARSWEGVERAELS